MVEEIAPSLLPEFVVGTRQDKKKPGWLAGMKEEGYNKGGSM